MFWLAPVSAVVGLAVAAVLARRAARGRADARRAAARAEGAAIRRAAELDAEAARLAAEAEAREQALEVRAQLEAELSTRVEELARREERVATREGAVAAEWAEAQARIEAVNAREREAQSRGDRARNAQKEAARLRDEALAQLEAQAGVTAEAVRAQLSEAWIEEAKAEAGNRLRLLDQQAGDPDWVRQAKRIMGVAVQRYRGHYLTERQLTNIALPPGLAVKLTANGGLLLGAIAEGAGVKLELSETGEKVRIDSGDGVAREVARRALQRIIKGTAPSELDRDPKRWVEQLATNLDREIMDLGKRAFAELEIPRAHPDIVRLVGRLNYRTSYSQNQWKHAIEAAFLGGMMAAELDLDVKLTRRATLMHDIGKSLSHEIEGSHAVIGADYARRLGEQEIVANAIGAHHADEPPMSIYAYLVAAADAMSGARPGARREQTEQYSTRLEDLERIGASFRGVERAIAVQGGREVRVYVRQDHVDDLRAVELSSEIARRIADELTFPGQIKVTVIRSFEAVEIAN